MLIKTIKKSGKTAELISYNKNPLHKAQSSTSRNSNYSHPSGYTHIKGEASYYKDKGKAKVSEKKRNERRRGGKDEDDDNSDDSDDDINWCEDSVSTKDKKYHKAEAYEPPKGVDEAICRYICMVKFGLGQI